MTMTNPCTHCKCLVDEINSACYESFMDKQKRKRPGPKPGPCGTLVGLPLRVSPALLERLRAAAARNAQTVGEVARTALDRGLR